MMQRRRKAVHVSDTWSVNEKNNILNLFSTAPGPHLTLFTPDSNSLPVVAYIVPSEFDFASYEKVVGKVLAKNEESSVSFARWIKDNGYPVPAICVEIKGSVIKNGYACNSAPNFSFGLLKSSSIQHWKQLDLYQETWCPSVWAATSCIPNDWTSYVTQHTKGKKLRSDITILKTLDSELPQHLKVYIVLRLLATHWHREDLLRNGANSLIQLKLFAKLEPNNFRNYLAESGLYQRSPSQVERLWAKLLNAEARVERFKAKLDAKWRREVQRFIANNQSNPFVFTAFKADRFFIDTPKRPHEEPVLPRLGTYNLKLPTKDY